MDLRAPDDQHHLNFIRMGLRGAPTVVLIHAVGTDLTYWDGQLRVLAERYDAVAYDLLGHGASPRPDRSYAIGTHARDLAGLIRDLGASSVHLVGLSVGGMIAQTLAVIQPHLVRSLTLIDTAATFSDQARTAFRQRAARTRNGGMAAVVTETLQRWFTVDFARRRPDMMDRVTKTLLANDPAIHAAMWDAIAELDLSEHLPKIRCPARVIVGEADSATPVAASDFIARNMPNAELHVLPGAPHLSPVERPSEVNALLLEFLAAHG